MFLELIASREKLTNPTSIEAYLLKALKRIIINRIYSEQKLTSLVDYPQSSFEIEFDFENKLIAIEQQQSKVELLNVALRSLSPEKKELLFLKFYSGLNNQEIGSMLGMNSETVQKQIYRILKKLQVKFIERFLELFYLCFKA